MGDVIYSIESGDISFRQGVWGMQEREPQTARLGTVQNVACSWLSYVHPIDRVVLNLCIYYPLTLQSTMKLGDSGIDRVTDLIRRGKSISTIAQ